MKSNYNYCWFVSSESDAAFLVVGYSPWSWRKLAAWKYMQVYLLTNFCLFQIVEWTDHQANIIHQESSFAERGFADPTVSAIYCILWDKV